MSNTSPEEVKLPVTDVQEPWVLCPAKFESYVDAQLSYGGGEYASRIALRKKLLASRMPEYACDCPLGPKSRFFGLGGQVCQQEVAYVAHPDPK